MNAEQGLSQPESTSVDQCAKHKGTYFSEHSRYLVDPKKPQFTQKFLYILTYDF